MRLGPIASASLIKPGMPHRQSLAHPTFIRQYRRPGRNLPNGLRRRLRVPDDAVPFPVINELQRSRNR